MIKISDRLRLVRKQQGLSQVEIADKLGITTRTYQNYEQGVTKLPAEELYKMVSLFGISADEFFGIEHKDIPIQQALNDLRQELKLQHEETRRLITTYLTDKA